jgi:hypothetical protein
MIFANREGIVSLRARLVRKLGLPLASAVIRADLVLSALHDYSFGTRRRATLRADEGEHRAMAKMQAIFVAGRRDRG